MGPATIVVPDDFPSVFDGTPAHERCRKIGETRVFTARGADDEAELIKRLDGARIAINIRAHARFTDAVMAASRKLEMISIWGTGTDNIDLDAAGRHGITVCNTPGINAFAVAEHAVALMLACARRIPRIDREVRGGAWPRDLLTQLLGKTLGVFGTGKIGGRVIALGRALGMDVLAYSARGDAAGVAALGARAASKEDICRRADVLSLHLRLGTDTRGFLGRREFAMMKPSAILINTGRGALIEREALLDALTQNKIAGAGLDVFHDEPLKPGDPFLALANVVLSPHNGGQTPEVIRDGLLRAIENVENYLAGKPTDTVVVPAKARR
ncbi:MAG TPA: NAD(P)-dependent oxidoreductase [Methylomirabilota bacterium]|jgi:D-3-phosphoglycerate dehydrogenase